MGEAVENNHQNQLDEAVRQFVEAQLRGEHPNLDEFIKKYPGQEQRIREKVKSCRQVSSLLDSLRQIEEIELQSVPAATLIGKRLGPFEVSEVLGFGGMGVVYKAEDTRLERVVAIKAMPATLLEDADAQMRFKREAKLLAALSHPHIGAIYDVLEQADGSSYLILEYIPGQTLAERIDEGPLPVKEALVVGQQIADALAAAYEKGIIHRDLKPGNIKITPEGKIKVLDFGIAKGIERQDQTNQNNVTEKGRLIGTPAYMSPEQVRGTGTDHRTDIWSFGCVMYEMIAGKHPFKGPTTSDTLASILRTEPDWQALAENTPENIAVLLRRCLEKGPRDRLQHIGDASVEIRETLNSPAMSPSTRTSWSERTSLQRIKKTKLRKMITIFGAAIIIVLCGLTVHQFLKRSISPSSREIRVAVLPFDNLGPVEDEYFATGITDAINSRLVGIHGLGVISRQSTMQYRNTDKNMKSIAKELHVDYILEGTVQRERPSGPNSRVRIIPRLVRVSDDSQLWSSIYDDDLSEVFRVQFDVAERVAKALNITLLKAERLELQSRPTQNMEAYDYYLRGNEYFHRTIRQNSTEIALGMYQKASELDPSFALAYARLCQTHARMYWFHYDRSPERLDLAKQAVDAALRLDPTLPEARLALGWYYYWGYSDYDRALEHFSEVRKNRPNDSSLLFGIGCIQRRRGEFLQAVANLTRASELDPLNSNYMIETGGTLALLRNYPEAHRYYERAVSIAPDLGGSYDYGAWLQLRWDGNTEKARTIVQEGMQNDQSAKSMLTHTLITLDIYDGNYQDALDRLSSKSEDIDNQWQFAPVALRQALIHGYMENQELALAHHESARELLEARIQEQPGDARFHASLGIVYAGLGRKTEAIRQGKLATELLPIHKDAWRGVFQVEALARIYVMVGEPDAAIDQLQHLLSIPGDLSPALLRIDPAWAPLRGRPRFEKLIATAN